LLGIVPAVAVKVPVVADAAIVTEAGTVNKALLLDSATTAPPAGAAPLKVTVQLEVAELAKLLGTHASEVGTIGGGPPPVTMPPVNASVIELAAAEAAIPLIPSVVLETPEAIVRFTTATVPFEMILAFIPEATQL
jgi:hypothetical protein